MFEMRVIKDGKEITHITEKDIMAFFDAMNDIADDGELVAGNDEEFDTETDGEEDDTTWVEDPEITECGHVISIGYNDDDDVVIINHDRPTNEYAIPAALARALSLTWPAKSELDKNFKRELEALAVHALSGEDD